MICPPPLEPGCLVRVVAPSSPFDVTLVRRGLAWLATRYKLRFDADLFARDGFLAGSDERRLRELNDALSDPKARAVVAARGGYGLTRIVERAKLDPLRARPKWIVGFSDLTALHLELQGAGIMSLHAHNVAGLGRGDTQARSTWCRALENPLDPQRFPGLTVYRAGTAAGPIVGGNLTVLFASHAAGRLSLPDASILLLEDVSEPSYRIDRMLTALMSSGVLARVSAIVLGEFTDCSPGKFGVETDFVLRERLGRLQIPVVAGLPVGHGRFNQPLTLGAWARLEGDELVVGAPKHR